MNLNLKRIFWPAVIGLAFAFTLWAQSPFYVGNFFDGVGVYIANGTNDASWMNVTNTLKVSGYLVDQGDLNVFGKESFDEGLISSDGLGHLTVVSITANSLTAPGGAVLPETNVVVYSGLSLGGSVGVGGGSIPVLSGSPLQFGLGTGLTYDANGIHAQYGINASNINAGTITNNVTAPNVTVTGNLIIPSGVKATNLSLYGTSTLQAGVFFKIQPIPVFLVFGVLPFNFRTLLVKQ